VAILEDGGLLTVGNVGDSRCILGQLRKRQLRVLGLSTDHIPDVPEEADRILSKNVSSCLRLHTCSDAELAADTSGGGCLRWHVESQGRIKPYMYQGMPVGPKRV